MMRTYDPRHVVVTFNGKVVHIEPSAESLVEMPELHPDARVVGRGPMSITLHTIRLGGVRTADGKPWDGR